MKALYGTLIGVVALLAVASLAVADDKHSACTSWDKQINKPGRFKALSDFGGAAVLDRETCLVWEQSPGTTLGKKSWGSAQVTCNNMAVGGRKGWRLPRVQELLSLIDPNNPTGDPDLPPAHPFSNVQYEYYWSATARTDDGIPWGVLLDGGAISATVFDPGDGLWIWCVRGGQAADSQ